LLDIVNAFPAAFDILHSIFNLGPLYLLQFVCWAVKMTGIKSVLEQVPVVKLFKFSDMLTLYKPYMGREYRFASTIHQPASLNVHRYSASLLVATQDFWARMFPGTIHDIGEMDLLPKGRLDLWWALTQPCNSFQNRLIGFFACKILRASCKSANVDFLSAGAFFEKMGELEDTMTTQKHCVVLAPNHKSAMDYILIKYIAFYMTCSGLDVPRVVARSEFDDSNMTQTLEDAKFDRHLSVAAFLEGSPRTDGRIGMPDAKALTKIIQIERDVDFTVVPMTLAYKSVNDSEVVLQATRNHSDMGLFDMAALYWQICILKKTKPCSLGDVRASFGNPSIMQGPSDVDATVKALHAEHKRLAKSLV
jgi:hypothetical protein